MDLYSAESKKIQTLIQDWLSHPEQELEATFGADGIVDATTFLNIAQRLRAKGYEPLPQDDRMSIITPNNIRLSLQGLGVLQTYCRDNALESKPYTAMIKDRTSLESNIDLEEYQCRIKSRREIPLSKDDPRIRELIERWGAVRKAYRLIRRWTFKGKGMRIDMSIVRSTPKDSKGEYRWSRTFQDYNIFGSAPVYEVEVELLREEGTSTPEGAVSTLVRGIGEILRAIQKNTLLIRKSIRDKVISQYTLLNGSDKFRGVAPITLERANMISEIDEKIPNIRTGYNVTDKADGLRCLGFCDSKGELFLIDMGMTVYRTGLQNAECADSLLDGEWVTKNKDGKAINHFLLFDIYYAPDKTSVSDLPFAIPGASETDETPTRWWHLRSWITQWNTEGATTIIARSGITDVTRLHVTMKKFIIAPASEPTAIFNACARILDTPQIYNTDGLILTPNDKPLPSRAGDTFYEQFKWKPASDNTIDFLINIEKDFATPTMDKVTTGVHPISGETTRFKTLRLFVGSVRDSAYDDPRATILNQLPLPNPRAGGKQTYKPTLFIPSEYSDTMANTCYCPVAFDPESGQEVIVTEHTNEPISNRSIVEMRYDPLQDPGWRWIPMRIRHDKTERMQKGVIARTLNSEKVANSVWNSIHDPVTVSMIRSGNEEPLESEVHLERRPETYYITKSPKKDIVAVNGLRDFHNRWIKGDIMYNSILTHKGKTRGGKSIIDFACGKAGDLQKWRFGRASFVLGIDTAGDNIRDPINGAYRRYMDGLIQHGKERMPQMVFAIGNSSKRIVTGEAGSAPEESDILRSIFGKSSPEGPVPKMIDMEVAGALRNGADVGVCMFALHYFFESKEILDGFFQNLADTIKTGGYFMGCCFDGHSVFNLLRGVERGESKVGMEGDVPLWTIRKEYGQDELTDDDDSIGMGIDVEFISIGAPHREYLVSYDYLVRRMKKIGFQPLTADESTELGLRNSTNMFRESYEMAQRAGKKYVMSDTVKEFSFLNRWFIFKRSGLGEVADDTGMKEAMEQLASVDTGANNEGDDGDNEDGDNEDTNADAVADVDADADEDTAVASESVTGARLPPPDKKFASAEIFLFGSTVGLQDALKMGDPEAGRWLSPNSLFPIRDPDEEGVEYPSITHFLAAMTIKHGAKKADLAKTLFSTTGSIHQRFEAMRTAKTASPAEILKQEMDAVKKALMPSDLRAYKAKIDAAEWNAKKDEVLREALDQRWRRDARFHRIVETARDKGKYLLYYTGSTGAGAWLSGVRRANGVVEGENKVGKIIMELAGFRFD